MAPGRFWPLRTDDRAPITKGEISRFCRFLQALETIETDLWQHYSELGGLELRNNESAELTRGNVPYTQALKSSMETWATQYITTTRIMRSPRKIFFSQ